MKYEIENKEKTDIKVGDYVLYDGSIRQICSNYRGFFFVKENGVISTGIYESIESLVENFNCKLLKQTQVAKFEVVN